MNISRGESLLDKTIGKEQQQKYTRAILLIQLAVLCIAVYFTTGFGDVFINEMASIGNGEGEAGSGEIGAILLVSGLILAVILRGAIYERITSEIPEIGHSTNFGDTVIGTPVSYLFWVIILWVILAFLLFIFSELIMGLILSDFYINVLTGVVFLFAAVVSSSIASVISSLGGSWRFPSDFRKKVQDIYEDIDDVNDTIKKSNEELTELSFRHSFTYLKLANSDLKEIRHDQMSFPVIDRRIENSEESIEQTAEDLVERAISGSEQAIDNKEYQSAQMIVNTIYETIDLLNVTTDREKLQSLREEISINLESQAKEKRKDAHAHIKQAATAGDKGNFSQAYDNIESAKKLISEIKAIGEQEIAGDVGSQVDEVEKRVSQLEDEEDISKIRESISNSYGIEKSKIKINQGTPKSYERLESLLNRIESYASAEASFLPWDQFRSNVVAGLPGMSETQIGNYHDIVYDIEVIIKFIDNIDESHPSVHADEWRTAMKTALSHQNQDILNPVTSQINRLKGNTLWEKEDLHKVDWEEFERLIGLLYEDLEYNTEVTQGTSDMGVDIWAKKGDDRIAIQVKQFSDGNTVGRETLQKITSTIAKGDADGAVVITSGDFARTATQYAEDFGSKLEIIDGDELIQLLSESDVPAPA